MKAVIMAAGYGTRFLPFSKAVSKTMLPIMINQLYNWLLKRR